MKYLITLLFLSLSACGGSYALSLGPNNYCNEDIEKLGKELSEHCPRAESACLNAGSLCRSAGVFKKLEEDKTNE